MPLTPSSTPLARLPQRLLLACSLLLSGCASTGQSLAYYWQSVRGHLQLMHAAEPIDAWLARGDTSQALRDRLALAQEARRFAVAELGLPDNASYRRYADLGRRAAVWNVVAAKPYSLTLHRWCFPITGCIGYRGYFNEADARAEAARLAAEGLEVGVYGVPAYSTLGYMNWAGGDPLLNTFIGWPEGEFVRLLFHELAHQVVYANGDTLFNESFATAVERLGVERWLAERATPQARADYAHGDDRRNAFRALTRAARERLAALYAAHGSDAPEGTASAPPDAQVETLKKDAMQAFRADYAALRARWIAEDGATPAQLAGYDRWVAEANNAAFGAQAAYDEWVPAFEALFQREGRDWPRFYDAVKHLAAQLPEQRQAAMRALLPAKTPEKPIA
ncbi:aminopeptidase [Paracidovorax valerianellae]|uniref:Predicted aminopeptidase n=1 Tax=Paracidovorax valerianellae TaxID=187868 RepID=A0A1G6ZLC7_9BURK|nr:aminopeptidase [Paracidovorax valerianellae]MDA8444344.1 aminopeptidase [Paracidovorax valerianellae]SDE03223.1 Predicted aminopeptidase [Paracidovorax valerianellae]